MFSTFVAAEPKKKAVEPKKKKYTFKIIKLEKCLTELEALLPAQTITEESKTDSVSPVSNYPSDLSGIVKLSLKYLKYCKEYPGPVLFLINFEFELDKKETERKKKPKKIIDRIISHIDKADKAPPNNIKVFSQLLKEIEILFNIYKFRRGRETPPYEEALLKIKKTEDYLLFYIDMIHKLFINKSFKNIELPNAKKSMKVISKIITHSDITNVEKWTYPNKWTYPDK